MIRYFQQQVLQPSQQVILQLLLQLQPLVYHQLLLTLEQDLMQLFVNNSIGNNAVLAINGTGGGDLLTASAAGTTKFNVNNNVNLQFKGSTAFTTTLTSLTGNDVTLTIPDTDTTDSFCLLTLANCTSAATQYWQLNSNLLSPANSTWDFAVGGTATSSSLFAITGVAAGTSVATLSASTNNNGISLTGSTATIQSLRNNTLNIGGTTTGLINVINNAGNAFATFDTVNSGLLLGAQGSINGALTFYSSGGATAPSISADSSRNLNISAPSGQVVLTGTGDIIIDPSTSNLVANLSS